MKELLHKSKLTIPSQKNFILIRERNHRLLDEAIQNKNILICAPSGYGKTTLAAEWSRHKNTTWLSLDKNDSYPQSFFRYLIAAMKQLVPSFGEGLLELIPQLDRLDVLSFFIRLANETEKVEDGAILILDDYHIASTPEMDKALQSFITYKSDKLSLILLSRKIPDIPWESWQVKNRMALINAEKLKLTLNEAQCYFQRVGGSIQDSQLSLLLEKTEGWFVGFHLAALACKGKPEKAGELISNFGGSNWNIIQYLSQEVLSNLDKDTRQLLFILSVPDTLTPSLCAYLLDKTADEIAVLLQLWEKSGFFIQSINQERTEFQFHSLFREVLLSSLEKQKEQKELIHNKTGQWYVLHEQYLSALYHFYQINHWSSLSKALKKAWLDSFANNENSLWGFWVKLLPEHIIEKDDLLSAQYAFLLLAEGKVEAAESRLTTLAHSSSYRGESDSKRSEPLTGMIDIGLAYLAQLRGDTENTQFYAKKMLRERAGKDPFHLLQAESLLGLSYLNKGEPKNARIQYEIILNRIRETDDYVNLFGIGFNLAEILLRMGDLTQAVILCMEILTEAESQGKSHFPGIEDIHRVLADLYREQGHRERAAAELSKAESLGENSLIIGWSHRIHKSKGRLAESMGDFKAAKKEYIQAEKYRNQSPLPDFPSLESLKERADYLTLINSGTLIYSSHKMNDKVSFLPTLIPESINCLIPQVMNPLFKSQPALDDTLKKLKQLERVIDETENRFFFIEVGILHALALISQGKKKQAAEKLDTILSLSLNEGILQVLLDYPIVFKQVLNQSAIVDRLSERNRKYLIRLFPPTHLPGEELSRREKEVLRLISKGYSNSQIADQLFVALDTVKGHNKRIFGKLQVKNRTEAVRKAEQIEIIQ